MSDFDDANRELFEYNLADAFGEDTVHRRDNAVLSAADFRAAWEYPSAVADFADFGEQLKRSAVISFSRTRTAFPRVGDRFTNAAAETFAVTAIEHYDNISVTVSAVKLEPVSAGHLQGK